MSEKNTKKAIPKPILGLPESVRVGICQYYKSGSPRIGLGSISIWGPTYTRFCGSSIQTVHAVKSTCQYYVHIFEINLLEYHTCHKLPVKTYMKNIICWCTVPVEICAAVLFMWRCRIVFGDCLPLSLALHHLPTTINRATTTPIFAQQRISTKPAHLIIHPKHHSTLRWWPRLSPQHTGARAQSHNA